MVFNSYEQDAARLPMKLPGSSGHSIPQPSESQMFDFDTLPRVAQTSKMPMDFATYLLSSSPPASNLDLLSLAFSPEAARRWEEEQQEIAEKDYNYEGCMNGVNIDTNGNYRQNLRKHRQGIKPIIIKKDEITSDGETSETSTDSGRVTPTSPCSPRINKKVSFADHKGFALATVRIMTEPSDQPPCIAADVIRSITKGAEPVASGLPPYKLAFSQPASDYMAFREKVDRLSVSLENVILRDYNVLGTIKVKNICFDKRVFVRVTFDSWVTSQDIEAKYVQPYGGNLVHNFDTFSFEFEIDTHSDTNKKVQFAVCFETPTGQNWDNNSGANYEIIPTDFSSPHPNHLMESLPKCTSSSLKKVDSWSEYSCWKHVDTSSPYY